MIVLCWPCADRFYLVLYHIHKVAWVMHCPANEMAFYILTTTDRNLICKANLQFLKMRFPLTHVSILSTSLLYRSAKYDSLYFKTTSVEKKTQETEIKLFKIWDGEYMEKGKSLDKISCVQDLSYADCTCSFRIMLFFQC